jgi:pimeloyl-ACP methyl ester carboxylesterase
LIDKEDHVMSKHTKKATIRSFMLAFHRLRFKVNAMVSPRRAAAGAAALFSTPVRPRRADLDAPVDIPAPLLREVTLASGIVTLYEWGNPATQPTVMLIHGWNGWALQFASFIAPLLANGNAVVALDHRGHGRSAGRRASLSGFIDTTLELLATLPKLSAVVGHSLGGAAAACTLAQSRTTAVKLVLLAPPNNPRVFLDKFAATLGIPGNLTDAIQNCLEQRDGRTFSEVSVGRIAPNIRADTLVIHDPADSVVPFKHGESYACLVNDARLAPLAGWGHFRILRSPDAVRLAVDFVSGGEPPCVPEKSSASMAG